ncbi:FkbM family methyltransferase [Methylobacterium sp. E-066]|uniref:FkbM family methyltransferase n=1 Tax=Methylobacterium sp. E-066 TaxID=2836584 RepID=UPI001FB94CD5|nr:FkbM family methyltransferase [Methylobacterium sp. E-066]MCJ2142950.1 FkbM family methyltransferase [Methylobacterium sp. E-066]
MINEDHIYSPLVKFGRARVIAFEPLVEKARERAESDSNVVMLNNFVGSGETGRFHVTRFDPASSLYEPDSGFLLQFSALKEMCEVANVGIVATTRLDDIIVIGNCDILKIDGQGGELDVLRGGSRVLITVACVHCKAKFSPVYTGQPLFSDVDNYLRALASS